MSRIGICALAVGLASLAAPAWAQYTPLFVIPTQNAAGVALPAGKAARVRITSVDAAMLARSLGVEVPADAASFEYLIDDYPQLQSRAERNWLEATFMVDFDQAAFAKLKDEMKGQGVRAERAALVAFVDELIDENFARGWDIASVIAERRQGDCSEHAVLTAALARAVGLPARVVVGVALISQGSEHAAFGHAWTEMLEGGKWVVADAALYGTDQAVRYVPLGLIEDEGFGYRMGLATLTRRWIQSVDVLEPR